VECRYVRSAEADGVAAAEPHQDAQTLSEAQEERPPGTSPGAFQRQLVSDESSPVRGLGFFRFSCHPCYSRESHIAYLEDENLTLKERLFLAQQEVNELRQRLRRGGSCISVVDEHDDACSDYGSSD